MAEMSIEEKLALRLKMARERHGMGEPSEEGRHIMSQDEKMALTLAFAKARFKKQQEATAEPVEPVIPVKIAGNQADKNRIATIVNNVAKSPTGKALMEHIANKGYTVCMTPGLQAKGVHNPANMTVALNPSFSNDMLTSTMAHEARHAVQVARGLNHYPTVSNAKTYFMIGQAIEADAMAHETKVCYELGQNGNTKAWQTVCEKHPVISTEYENSIKENPKNASNGKALDAAFKGFYKETATRSAYEDQLSGHLSMYRNEKTLPEFDSNGGEAYFRYLPADELVKACCMDDTTGKPYFTDKPETLEGPEYLAVSKNNMRQMAMVNMGLKQIGRPTDDSLKEITIRELQSYKAKQQQTAKPKAAKLDLAVLAASQFQHA